MEDLKHPEKDEDRAKDPEMASDAWSLYSS